MKHNEQEDIMVSCAELTRDMLPNPVAVDAEQGAGMEGARERAVEEARKRMTDPMLLGWYDRATGAFSPQVECCSEEKPGWVVYAETRGGSLTVDVNGGAYYFIFGDMT
ncbi:MAG: AF1514 family protein [Deltaproteobacteria bacterium]|nr:AF1514 family protein [Deltaproteobacteria bacterium]